MRLSVCDARVWAVVVAVLIIGADNGVAEAAPQRAEAPDISNWAGYVVHGAFRTVTASWVQPTVVCTHPGVVQEISPWVGLNGDAVDGALALPLVQTGTETTCDSVSADIAADPGLALQGAAADWTDRNPPLAELLQLASQNAFDTLGPVADRICAFGALGDACRARPDSRSWWEAYPEPPHDYSDAVVRPGDTVRATVTYDGVAYTTTLENRTRGWTRSTQRESPEPARTAEVVVEGVLDNALPRFTPITFTDIAIDGKPLSAFPAQPTGIAATNRSLFPGPIDTSGFTVGKPHHD
ncbi:MULTISPECIES: G1 family glutamic endopeptidase [unclassified Nocardia]|uniref:G1 family glutamic endopeptidase n=1 Tax=unclassified Nocardia TaxID=2637762 RepID=UPI001CE3CF0F|nr:MULTISPECIES: G1 family glutamic endopeptidase [unclassified Nocardia]